MRTITRFQAIDGREFENAGECVAYEARCEHDSQLADRMAADLRERVARRCQWLHDQGRELRKTMQCNCDLDRWEPTTTTGHTWACRIHKAVLAMPYEDGATLTANVLPTEEK
jgi:hypothetical protein